MNQPLHQQANALLYQVLEQPAASRPAFLKQACGGSRALLDMVNSMLSHIDQLDAFLEDRLAMPVVAEEPAVRWPQAGEIINGWRLLREVQRGALGTFLLVQREGGARAQLAALKIVDAEALTLEELALFHRQRELVARLSHPNMTRVIDSGTVPDGRPYFVVQYSDGVPLAEFCAATGLSARERVKLFVPVCHAVHHAHQHLVLHRRLAPESVVVDRDGLVKVLDMGIAGLLDAPGQERTPGTTAVDVQALGRALAVLLQDQPKARRGDLADILARANALDAHDEDSTGVLPYGSAIELARDLQRYLDKRPLQGNEHAVLEWIGKASRRRPARAFAAFLVAAAVAAGSAVGWHQLATDTALHQRAYELAGIDTSGAAGRSRAALASARYVAGSVVSLADRRNQAESMYMRGGMGNLHEALQAWHILAIAAEEKGDPDIQTVALERVATLRRVAGDTAGAHAGALELLSTLERILQRVPDQPGWRARQANALQLYGAVAIDRGDTPGAVAALRQALALREELAGEEPSTSAAQGIAAARVALGHGLVAARDYAGAETEYRLAREVYAAQADGEARAKVWEIDMARIEGQYLRKHYKTAAATMRQWRESLGDGGGEMMQARAALLEALIQPDSNPEAYARAQRMLPTLLAPAERDPDDTIAMRESAASWRRVGEIGLRAGVNETSCGYLTRADRRYEELEAAKRASAQDRAAREELAALMAVCE